MKRRSQGSLGFGSLPILHGLIFKSLAILAVDQPWEGRCRGQQAQGTVLLPCVSVPHTDKNIAPCD